MSEPVANAIASATELVVRFGNQAVLDWVQEVARLARGKPEVAYTYTTIGGRGDAVDEGTVFVKLTPKLAAYGTSFRCNEEGARQLREVLDVVGIELLVVPMAGWSIHIDGHIGMVDVDKALVDIAGLPYWFLDRLRAFESTLA